MKKWMIGVVAILVIAVGVGAFFGGRASVEGASGQTVGLGAPGGQSSGDATTRPSFPGGASGVAGSRGVNMISGTIIAVDETGITVQASDGGSKIVLLAPSTAIVKTEKASQQDLAVGEEVMVAGTANTDGSVTASRIQLGSALLGAGRPATGESSASESNTTLSTEGAPSSTTTQSQ